MHFFHLLEPVSPGEPELSYGICSAHFDLPGTGSSVTPGCQSRRQRSPETKLGALCLRQTRLLSSLRRENKHSRKIIVSFQAGHREADPSAGPSQRIVVVRHCSRSCYCQHPGTACSHPQGLRGSLPAEPAQGPGQGRAQGLLGHPVTLGRGSEFTVRAGAGNEQQLCQCQPDKPTTAPRPWRSSACDGRDCFVLEK